MPSTTSCTLFPRGITRLGFTFLVLAFLTASVAAPARAAAKPPVHLETVVNGKAVPAESRAVLVNRVILIPLYVLAERLGLTTSWLEETRTVRLESFGKVVYLPLGTKVGMVNGQSFKLLEPAQIIGDRSYVPLRFLSEVLDFEVRYLERDRKVEVRAPEYSITDIRYVLADGKPQLLISGTRTPSAIVTLKQNPLRLLVELGAARLTIPAGTLPTEDPLLPEVSWVQAKKDLVRLTVNLGREMPYTLTPVENRLALAFPPQVRAADLVLDAGRRLITVRSTTPLKPSLTLLANPDRLVMDFPEAVLAAPSRVVLKDAWVQGIRLGQLNPHTVRVVADLEGPLAFFAEPPVPSPEPGAMWSLHLLNRVSQVTFRTLKDRTELHLKLAVAATPTVIADRRAGRLELDLPEAVGDGLAAEVPVQDGTVERLRLLEPGPGTVRWAVELPYYVGHEVLPAKGAEAVVEVSRSPVYRQRIYLDPGHGGADPGAVSPGGLMEKEVNLDVALRVRQLLSEAGAEVLLSREADLFVPLYDRPRSANAQNAAVFVSIHANANLKPAESGTETYYHPDHPGSRELAAEVQERLVAGLKLLDRSSRPSREFVVVRETSMPAVLAELAFLSNPAEERLLGDPAFRQRAAQAITDGIVAYFRDHAGHDII